MPWILLALAPMLLLAAAAYTWLAARAAERDCPPIGRFLTAGGRRLHYLEAGEGAPVVLLHGNPGTLHHFTLGLVAALASDFRVIAFDRPGHGYSERGGGDAGSPLTQAQVIHDALEALGVRRPVLVAESWSGSLALAYALEYPESLGGVVLAEATVYPEPRLVAPIYHVVLAPILGPIFTHTLGLPLGRLRIGRGLAAAFAPAAVRPDLLRVAQRLWVRPAALVAVAADAVRRDQVAEALCARYREVEVPVTIVAALADRYVDPRRQSLRLHRELPQGRLVEVHDLGHLMLETRPDEVADAVRQVALRTEPCA